MFRQWIHEVRAQSSVSTFGRILPPARVPAPGRQVPDSSIPELEAYIGEAPWLPDGAAAQAIPDDLPGLAREIRELVVSLLHPDAVKGPAMESARYACVTLVLSDELGATLEAAIVKGTGMRPH